MEKKVVPARRAQEYFERYSVINPEKAAAAVLNPLTDAVLAFAEAEGRRLAKLLGRGVKPVVGGSLGYGALMKNNFDIDLRLLLPATASKAQIDAATIALLTHEGFANPRFIDEGGGNYIWHVKRKAHIPALKKLGDPEVDLTINVQSAKGYGGIAATSARMPREVIVRYIVAKAKSKAESPACYTAVKEYWKVFIKWAQARGVDRMKPGAIAKLLDKNADLFPLFLKEKE